MAGLTLASRSAERGGYSPWRETWRRYRRHKLAVVSAVLLLVLAAAVIFGPFVWRVAINEIDFTARLEGPSLAHPFGTDDLGQDILARMIYGGRISLAVGLAAMAVSVIVGTLIGALAGMSRGALGHALMWLTDLFLSLPQLPLLLLLIYLFRDGLKAAFGPEGGISPREFALLEEAGATRVRLGAEVLRTSTAGPAALAVLNARLGRW